MSKTIDAQTHKDIVGLIEAEMGEVACGSHVGAERLACVIEGRMGYETPRRETWILTDSGEDIIEAGTTVNLVGRISATPEQMQKMAAAPDLAEALNTMRKSVRELSASEKAHVSQEAWDGAIAALEKAGVEL